jgi:predicted metal-dependent phosphoesterase TrpH
MAKSLNLKAISVTDHDTSDSISSLQEIQGIEEDILSIKGMEMTTSYHEKEVHILIYGLNARHASNIDEFTRKTREEREERTRRVIELYNKKDLLKASYEEIAEHLKYPGKTLTLLQVLAYCVEKRGLTHEEVKHELFHPDGIVYVKCDRSKFISATDAVEFAQDLGGVPVLAHPGDYVQRNDGSILPAFEIVKELIGHGLMGIEAAHSRHSVEQIEIFREMANRFHLLATAGSDWHGFEYNKKKFGSLSMSERDLEYLLSIAS